MQTATECASKSRPFPRDCYRCGKREVYPAVIPYSVELDFEGAQHVVDIPQLETPRCRACGEIIFDASVDAQINTAERTHLRLLQPVEIRAGRARLALSRVELATRLGVAEAALADWEEDISIQSRAADNLLRVFFAFPEVRAALSGKERDAALGVLVA
jgi:DNA-binding transcriptional regulator YiaG